MAGTGVGGLFSGLINPGLRDDVARSLTPNPSPLAQQGITQPGTVDGQGNPSAPPPGANLAPAAATQGDPINTSYTKNLMKYADQAALAADFNRNLEGMAAGFGTASQQASKQQALARGGVGGGLADLAAIQEMQGKTIQDNEHARFMASAATFAQTLSTSLGRPVSVQEATTIMNSPELMKDFGGAAGANAQTTDKLKDADAEARAWADAHPKATAAEIAQHKSDFLAQTAGGLSSIGKNLAEDRRNWHAQNPGKSDAEMIADKPELADETTYVTVKTEQAKEGVLNATARTTAKSTFTQVDPQWQKIEENVEWLADPAHKASVLEALRAPDFETTGQKGRLANWLHIVGKDTQDAKRRLDLLKNEGFTSEFKNTKNIRSNTEANRIGAAFSGLFSPTITDDAATEELNRLTDMVHDGRANVKAAAGQKIDSKYSNANIDPDYLDPKSPLFNGATREYDVPTSAQIDKLKSNPSLAGDFDKKFGPGSAQRALGR